MPVLAVTAILVVLWLFRDFSIVYVMTQGGPLSSTLSVSYHIYNQFGFGNYGYASAAAYVLFVAIVALSVLQFRLLGARND